VRTRTSCASYPLPLCLDPRFYLHLPLRLQPIPPLRVFWLFFGFFLPLCSVRVSIRQSVVRDHGIIDASSTGISSMLPLPSSTFSEVRIQSRLVGMHLSDFRSPLHSQEIHPCPSPSRPCTSPHRRTRAVTYMAHTLCCSDGT